MKHKLVEKYISIVNSNDLMLNGVQSANFQFDEDAATSRICNLPTVVPPASNQAELNTAQCATAEAAMGGTEGTEVWKQQLLCQMASNLTVNCQKGPGATCVPETFNQTKLFSCKGDIFMQTFDLSPKPGASYDLTNIYDLKNLMKKSPFTQLDTHCDLKANCDITSGSGTYSPACATGSIIASDQETHNEFCYRKKPIVVGGKIYDPPTYLNQSPAGSITNPLTVTYNASRIPDSGTVELITSKQELSDSLSVTASVEGSGAYSGVVLAGSVDMAMKSVSASNSHMKLQVSSLRSAPLEMAYDLTNPPNFSFEFINDLFSIGWTDPSKYTNDVKTIPFSVKDYSRITDKYGTHIVNKAAFGAGYRSVLNESGVSDSQMNNYSIEACLGAYSDQTAADQASDQRKAAAAKAAKDDSDKSKQQISQCTDYHDVCFTGNNCDAWDFTTKTWDPKKMSTDCSTFINKADNVHVGSLCPDVQSAYPSLQNLDFTCPVPKCPRTGGPDYDQYDGIVNSEATQLMATDNELWVKGGTNSKNNCYLNNIQCFEPENVKKMFTVNDGVLKNPPAWPDDLKPCATLNSKCVDMCYNEHTGGPWGTIPGVGISSVGNNYTQFAPSAKVKQCMQTGGTSGSGTNCKQFAKCGLPASKTTPECVEFLKGGDDFKSCLPCWDDSTFTYRGPGSETTDMTWSSAYKKPLPVISNQERYASKARADSCEASVECPFGLVCASGACTPCDSAAADGICSGNWECVQRDGSTDKQCVMIGGPEWGKKAPESLKDQLADGATAGVAVCTGAQSKTWSASASTISNFSHVIQGGSPNLAALFDQADVKATLETGIMPPSVVQQLFSDASNSSTAVSWTLVGVWNVLANVGTFSSLAPKLQGYITANSDKNVFTSMVPLYPSDDTSNVLFYETLDLPYLFKYWLRGDRGTALSLMVDQMGANTNTRVTPPPPTTLTVVQLVNYFKLEMVDKIKRYEFALKQGLIPCEQSKYIWDNDAHTCTAPPAGCHNHITGQSHKCKNVDKKYLTKSKINWTNFNSGAADSGKLGPGGVVGGLKNIGDVTIPVRTIVGSYTPNSYAVDTAAYTKDLHNAYGDTVYGSVTNYTPAAAAPKERYVDKQGKLISRGKVLPLPGTTALEPAWANYRTAAGKKQFHIPRLRVEDRSCGIDYTYFGSDPSTCEKTWPRGDPIYWSDPAYAASVIYSLYDNDVTTTETHTHHVLTDKNSHSVTNDQSQELYLPFSSSPVNQAIFENFVALNRNNYDILGYKNINDITTVVQQTLFDKAMRDYYGASWTTESTSTMYNRVDNCTNVIDRLSSSKLKPYLQNILTASDVSSINIQSTNTYPNYLGIQCESLYKHTRDLEQLPAHDTLRLGNMDVMNTDIVSADTATTSNKVHNLVKRWYNDVNNTEDIKMAQRISNSGMYGTVLNDQATTCAIGSKLEDYVTAIPLCKKAGSPVSVTVPGNPLYTMNGGVTLLCDDVRAMEAEQARIPGAFTTYDASPPGFIPYNGCFNN